jgi:predicted nucleotide-binding protein (sugar kinase/HSP70/actin superfamily)
MNGKTGEVVIYFMPETGGPCRFGQYNVFLKNFILKRKIRDIIIIASLRGQLFRPPPLPAYLAGPGHQ